MADYFIPDRSHRPGDIIEGHGQTKELFRGVELVGELDDGRPFVMELTAVDGYPVHFFYFDIRGLEQASLEELRVLIEAALGKPIFPDVPGTVTNCWASPCRDAQGREMWEFGGIWFEAD